MDQARAGLDRQRAAAVRRPACGGVVLDVAVARQVHGRDAVRRDADPGAAEPTVAVRVGGAAGLAARAGGAALVHATGAGRAGDAGPGAVAGGHREQRRARAGGHAAGGPDGPLAAGAGAVAEAVVAAGGGRGRRVQSLRTSVPETAGVHCPRVPTPPQVMQAPQQAFSQQTPSTQKPLWQSPVDAAGRTVRLLRRADCPPSRSSPPCSRCSAVHVVAQDVAPHTYGAQEAVVAARQVPAPSHVRGSVSVEPLHVSPQQLVPAT